MKRIIALALAALLALSSMAALAVADKEMVKKVQQTLNDVGYDCGTPDGVAGKKTRAAIESYQKDKGLEATGEIDDALLAAMGLAKKQEQAGGNSEAGGVIVIGYSDDTIAAADTFETAEAGSKPDIPQANMADFEVPELPAEAIALTGGIPKTIDLLIERYVLEDINEIYARLSEVSAADLLNTLVTTGACNLPNGIPVPYGGGIWYYDDDHNQIGERQELAITAVDEGLNVKTTADAPNNPAAYDVYLDIETLGFKSELYNMSDIDSLKKNYFIYDTMDGGNAGISIHSDGRIAIEAFARDKGSGTSVMIQKYNDGYWVLIEFGEHEWSAFYNMEGEIYRVNYYD